VEYDDSKVKIQGGGRDTYILLAEALFIGNKIPNEMSYVFSCVILEAMELSSDETPKDDEGKERIRFSAAIGRICCTLVGAPEEWKRILANLSIPQYRDMNRDKLIKMINESLSDKSESVRISALYNLGLLTSGNDAMYREIFVRFWNTGLSVETRKECPGYLFHLIGYEFKMDTAIKLLEQFMPTEADSGVKDKMRQYLKKMYDKEQ
jgi:hypothetical protein